MQAVWMSGLSFVIFKVADQQAKWLIWVDGFVCLSITASLPRCPHQRSQELYSDLSPGWQGPKLRAMLGSLS